jgi:hypothetical protein
LAKGSEYLDLHYADAWALSADEAKGIADNINNDRLLAGVMHRMKWKK